MDDLHAYAGEVLDGSPAETCGEVLVHDAVETHCVVSWPSWLRVFDCPARLAVVLFLAL